ncbi:MAG: hypothetical protein MJ159_06290 [Treponemataceae bacterium]|nr:hypothetical protein [Treponemataceae bacterium]
MKKRITVYCILLFIISTLAFCAGGERALTKHPEFINIEQKWGDKLGTHYLVNLTGNRILEFDQIDSRTGGGKYAGLRRIGEFEVRGSVIYKKTKVSWKNTYGKHVRFQDLSQLLGIKIETMVDCINNYDEILNLVKQLAREQYLLGYEKSIKLKDNNCFYDDRIINEFSHHFTCTEDRIGLIRVISIYNYIQWVWDGIQEEELKQCKNWVNEFGENWENNVPYDKIRKSLGLE